VNIVAATKKSYYEVHCA